MSDRAFQQGGEELTEKRLNGVEIRTQPCSFDLVRHRALVNLPEVCSGSSMLAYGGHPL